MAWLKEYSVGVTLFTLPAGAAHISPGQLSRAVSPGQLGTVGQLYTTTQHVCCEENLKRFKTFDRVESSK